MTKNLKQEIDGIVRQLVTYYKPEKIILFGSAARGDMGPDSDLDFCVIKGGLDEVPRHKRIGEVLHIIPHNVATDVLVYTPWEIKKRLYLKDPFFVQMFSEGKVLYGA